MAIKITNGKSRVIKIAVSTWEAYGKDGYFEIDPGDTGNWDRKDQRGYLMVVEDSTKAAEYYISFNSSIVIEDNHVKDHGKTINPLFSANNL